MKSIVEKLVKFITNPIVRFGYLSRAGFYNHMSDEEWLKKRFKLLMGYPLDLENPKTFNEKLQWLKLYDRRPEYTTMVDKYESKKYVAGLIGEEYIIPTLGVWDRLEDINFDELPNQFVLKCTHDSGGVFIVRNKNTMDKETVKKKIKKSLKQNYYYLGREWPYKNVKPRVIAEKYMEDPTANELRDYKIFCFDGMPRFILTVEGGHVNEADVKRRLYDVNWKKVDVGLHGKKNEESVEPRPKQLEKILEVASILSKGMKHLRVDLYIVNEKIYFGELTFAHMSGFEHFSPVEFDLELGSYLTLEDNSSI